MFSTFYPDSFYYIPVKLQCYACLNTLFTHLTFNNPKRFIFWEKSEIVQQDGWVGVKRTSWEKKENQVRRTDWKMMAHKGVRQKTDMKWRVEENDKQGQTGKKKGRGKMDEGCWQ